MRKNTDMKSVVIICVAAVVIVAAACVVAKAHNAKKGSQLSVSEKSLAGAGNVQSEEISSPVETIMSNDYLSVFRNGYGEVSVYFNIESEVPFAIGEKMEQIDERAYMNGVAWEGLLNYVMKERCPELLKTINTDSEAGTYVAYFPDNAEGIMCAKRLGELIVSLIDNEEELFSIVRDHAEEIKWEDF